MSLGRPDRSQSVRINHRHIAPRPQVMDADRQGRSDLAASHLRSSKPAIPADHDVRPQPPPSLPIPQSRHPSLPAAEECRTGCRHSHRAPVALSGRLFRTASSTARSLQSRPSTTDSGRIQGRFELQQIGPGRAVATRPGACCTCTTRSPWIPAAVVAPTATARPPSTSPDNARSRPRTLPHRMRPPLGSSRYIRPDMQRPPLPALIGLLAAYDPHISTSPCLCARSFSKNAPRVHHLPRLHRRPMVRLQRKDEGYALVHHHPRQTRQSRLPARR